MIEVKKKEGESSSALMFRFIKKVKRSGVLKEANKRRFRTRKSNKRSRRISAIYRAKKKAEYSKSKKAGN